MSTRNSERNSYPSDVSDDEWPFVAPYLTLMTEDAPQRDHPLREAFNGARWIVRTGAQWRMMPNDLPPWYSVYQQTQRWIKAGSFEGIVHDLRELLRVAQGKKPQLTAAILDGRTCSLPRKVGHEQAMTVTKGRIKAEERQQGSYGRGHTGASAGASGDARQRAGTRLGSSTDKSVQEATEQNVEVAFVDQGYTGDAPAEAAQEQGIRLEVIKLPEAKKGFVLLPRRWVVERSFGWGARFRRLARDYERLPETLAGLHFVAFASLMLFKVVRLLYSI